MKTFKLFSMAALALMMAACNENDDNEIVTPGQTAKAGAVHFSATVAAPGSGATTRTAYTEVTEGEDAGKINVAWVAGDEIYIDDDNSDATCTATVGEVAADGSATISGTFSTEVNAGANISAYYPALSMTNPAAFMAKFESQDGTLAFIQNNLDYRMGMSSISVAGNEATLASPLKMDSQIAIWKLTLQNSSSEPLAATKVTVKSGSDVMASTTNIGATSTVYLAVHWSHLPVNATVTIEATVGSDTYTYSKTGISLAAGNYYQSTVTMAKPITLTLTSPAVGQVIGSDGKNYAASSVPSGVTKVAMIAYVSGSNGLAIALADEASSMDLATAIATCEAKTPAFTGGTWKLPSKDEWQQMFNANGGATNKYSGLHTALSKAGGSKLVYNVRYYTSTLDGEGKAYRLDMGLEESSSANWSIGDVTSTCYVRAVLAF